MRLLVTFCMLLFISVIPAKTQIIDDFFDLVPGRGSQKLAESGVSGFIDYQYSGKISKARGEANHFSAVFIDSIGRIVKTVEFNRFNQPENYSCYTFDDPGNLVQRAHYDSGGKLLWHEGFFYDVSGKLIERVEYAEDGSVDGKTLYFFNAEGHLYKTRQLNYAGELSFWQIIHYSATNLPGRISLKQAQGFTMSNTHIHYNDHSLPVERIVSAGAKGPVTREKFLYDDDALLTEQRTFNEGDLKSILVRNYCRGNFPRMLMENKLYTDDVKCTEKAFGSLISGFTSRASFPGGIEGLNAYLTSVVQMPDSATQQGVVMVVFEVKSNGKIRKVKVQKALSPLLDEMAVDIVMDMPPWIPAQSPDGKPEKSKVYLPVVFLK
ncbi:energy transducer TonB [Marinilabilia sp.]|uniref:energy transducer TonB n=1 Tax=Marinilabilia sp. TaxID=2021252 RepID=UPI0025BAFD8B|nr:energy transducer TonB [Marinilabilia sp.]